MLDGCRLVRHQALHHDAPRADVLKSVRVHDNMSREAETVATTAGHFAYGTFTGTMYGALPVAIRRHALASGVV